MKRRNFLVASVTALVAPAIIRTPGLLMPVKTTPGDYKEATAWLINDTIHEELYRLLSVRPVVGTIKIGDTFTMRGVANYRCVAQFTA